MPLILAVALALAADVPRCQLPMLMQRTDALPPSAEFTLGAKAFDNATADWSKRRFVEAARGFMSASAHFASAGVEGNWKYAWQNAVAAFEASGKIDEGKAAFEAAAAKDPPHAEALRTAADALTARTGCH